MRVPYVEIKAYHDSENGAMRIAFATGLSASAPTKRLNSGPEGELTTVFFMTSVEELPPSRLRAAMQPRSFI